MMSMKFGLANSINTVTAYIMKQFGPQVVVDLARKMGITSRLLPVPSICLGTFDLSVYEMVGAYATFSNKGIWTEPIIITRIEDKNGVVLEDFSPKTMEAMSAQTADIMVRMLQGVVDGVENPEDGTKREQVFACVLGINFKMRLVERQEQHKTILTDGLWASLQI